DLNIIATDKDSTTPQSHRNADKPILDTLHSFNLRDAYKICKLKFGPTFTYYKIEKKKGKTKLTAGSRLDYLWVSQDLENNVKTFSTGSLKFNTDHLDIMATIQLHGT